MGTVDSGSCAWRTGCTDAVYLVELCASSISRQALCSAGTMIMTRMVMAVAADQEPCPAVSAFARAPSEPSALSNQHLVCVGAVSSDAAVPCGVCSMQQPADLCGQPSCAWELHFPLPLCADRCPVHISQLHKWCGTSSLCARGLQPLPQPLSPAGCLACISQLLCVVSCLMHSLLLLCCLPNKHAQASWPCMVCQCVPGGLQLFLLL